MTGTGLLTAAGAGAAALLLVAAGAGHLRHRRMFAAVLAAQRTLPHRVQPVVAAAMGPLELGLGLALAASLLLGLPATRLVALAAGAVYLAFGAYIARVWRTRPRVPCGCFGADTPVSGTTVLRAVLLGAACVAAGLAGVVRPGDATEALLAVGGAVVLAAAFWLLPQLAT